MAVSGGALEAGTSALGAVGGAIGAIGSSKKASAAMEAQQRAQQEQLDFQRQQYNRYMGMYGPIEEHLANQAKSNQPLFYDQNKAQIQQQYAQAMRNQGAQMGMRGLAGSGVDLGMMRAGALGQAGALSGAYSQGMQNRLALQQQLANKNMPFLASQGVTQGMQGMANLYGGQANMYNQAAAQGWQNFGQGLQGMAGAFGQMNWGGNSGLAAPQSPMTPPSLPYGDTSLPAGMSMSDVPTGIPTSSATDAYQSFLQNRGQ